MKMGVAEGVKRRNEVVEEETIKMQPTYQI